MAARRGQGDDETMPIDPVAQPADGELQGDGTQHHARHELRGLRFLPARRHGVEAEEAQARGFDRGVQRRRRHGDWRQAEVAERAVVSGLFEDGRLDLGRHHAKTGGYRQGGTDRVGPDALAAQRGEDERTQREADGERGGIAAHGARPALLGAERVEPGLGQHEQHLGGRTQQEAQREPQPDERHRWKQHHQDRSRQERADDGSP